MQIYVKFLIFPYFIFFSGLQSWLDHIHWLYPYYYYYYFTNIAASNTASGDVTN